MLRDTEYTIIDIATTAIPGAAEYIEEPSAPANYKDPQKIADYIAEAKAKAIDKCALDADLGALTALGIGGRTNYDVMLCRNEADERIALETLALITESATLITFNGSAFDLPFLVRRAFYLGVELHIDLDRYRSPHIDLYDKLTNHGRVSGHSLGFYAKRLGWTDLTKPLSGAEEARVPETGRWAELEQSVIHDLTATRRLAAWMRVIPQPTEKVREAVA